MLDSGFCCCMHDQISVTLQNERINYHSPSKVTLAPAKEKYGLDIITKHLLSRER